MINKNKYDILLSVLRERELSFDENYHCPLCNVDIDLFVPKLGIAIFDGDSQEKYEAVKRMYAPIFIREYETEEKTKEKIVNTINKRISYFKKQWEKQKAIEVRKRYTLECEERHKMKAAMREYKNIHNDGLDANGTQTNKRKRQRIVRYEKV